MLHIICFLHTFKISCLLKDIFYILTVYDQLTGPSQLFLQLLQVTCWVFFHLVGLVLSQQSLLKQLKGTTSVEECVTSDSDSLNTVKPEH